MKYYKARVNIIIEQTINETIQKRKKSKRKGKQDEKGRGNRKI